MKKTTWFTLWLIAIGLGGCAGTMGLNPGYGVVVVYQALPGSTTKYGINALSDTGRRLFGPAELKAPSRLGNGGGTSAYGGMGVPEWVRVTWREPIYGQKIATTGKTIETLDFGKILGDHRIEVRKRIPDELFEALRRDPKGVLRIKFLLTDDGVLLGWDIERDPSRMDRQWLQEYKQRTGLPSFVSVYEMAGGDFEETKIYNGKVVGKGWYINKKTGQKVWTDY